MSENTEIEIEDIQSTRYSRFLTYPSSEALKETKERAEQLKAIGIRKLLFTGPSSIDGIRLLGKGSVGIVVEAIHEKTPVALKIRRMDADRATMYEEARLLRLANSVNVGPRLITATTNFLVMQLIDGLPLFKWAEHTSKRSNAKEVLRQLLTECFKLDAIGLDHGELSHTPRNVLISSRNKPCIVDFESASSSRRVTNVTSLIQYFLFGQLAENLWTPKLYTNRKTILKALTTYKQDGSVSNFNNILQSLRLNPLKE